MSVEEDVELRELVAQTLESNGCLAKIKVTIYLLCNYECKIEHFRPNCELVCF